METLLEPQMEHIPNPNGPPQQALDDDDLMVAFYEAQKILDDPAIHKAIRKMDGQNSGAKTATLEKRADEKVKKITGLAKKYLERVSNGILPNQIFVEKV